jgi:biopolymer transport protein TolR
MPSVTARHGSRRRSINEINMVPFIDVMLVLLIIFMVTAPLITTGVVDLPSVGKSSQRPTTVIEIVVENENRMRIKSGGEEQPVSRAQLAQRVKQAQAGDAEVPVVISADKGIKYDSVITVMRALQEANVQRIGLSVKQGG